MRIYGLTGGIGSGKSEVAKLLSQARIPVIDADGIGHAVLEKGGPGFQKVLEAFGEAILTNGAIDRAKLSSLVFTASDLRRTLNAIVHPIIQTEIAKRCTDLATQGHTVAVIEAALLAEGGKMESYLDGLILVTCPEEVRVRRLTEGRGMAKDEALRRISAQTPPESKLALSDHVIDNSGRLEELGVRVEELAKELLAHG